MWVRLLASVDGLAAYPAFSGECCSRLASSGTPYGRLLGIQGLTSAVVDAGPLASVYRSRMRDRPNSARAPITERRNVAFAVSSP